MRSAPIAPSWQRITSAAIWCEAPLDTRRFSERADSQSHRTPQFGRLVGGHDEAMGLQRVVVGLADAAAIAVGGGDEGAGEGAFARPLRPGPGGLALGRVPGRAGPVARRLAIGGDDDESG